MNNGEIPPPRKRKRRCNNSEWYEDGRPKDRDDDDHDGEVGHVTSVANEDDPRKSLSSKMTNRTREKTMMSKENRMSPRELEDPWTRQVVI